MMNKRRITWLLYNAAMTPFIPFRALLLIIARLGEAAEWIGLRTPGWRTFDGWSYGYEETRP